MSKKPKLSSTGFSVVAVVGIIFAIAVLGFGGWYVWQKNKQTTTQDQTNTAHTQNNAKKPNQTGASTQAADPSEGGKYLVVTEWGVRFLLPEELRGDAHYAYSTKPSLSSNGGRDTGLTWGEGS